MKQDILISIGFLAGLFVLVLSGCGGNDLDRRPCTEDLPCPQPTVNSCPNLTPGEWTFLGLENEDVTAIAAHPCNPGIIYAGTQRNFSEGVQGKLFRSTDCGQSWDTLAVGGSYHAIHFSPTNPDVVYALNDHILKSTNGGSRWRRADEGIRLDSETFAVALAINPTNACRLYAGTGGFYGGDLYRSDNGGESWRQVFEREVTAIAIDPADPAQIFIGSYGNVLRSTDGGDQWEATGLSDTGSFVHSLLIDPANKSVLYAGLNQEGLHTSRNSGKSWSVVTNEFLADTTSVVELAMDGQNKVLHVATTYSDSGTLLAYHTSSDTWEELPVPITDKSFYYSKLKVHEFKGRVYTYFGIPSGIYVRIDE
ncbi:MAG: hypothetical protein WD604_14335 [Balneolaceae bacterium]